MHEASSHQDNLMRLDRQLGVNYDEHVRCTHQKNLEKIGERRPPNTRRTYEVYQKEFTRWCNDNRFADGNFVLKEKLELYHSDCVFRTTFQKEGK